MVMWCQQGGLEGLRYALPTYRDEVAVRDLKNVSKHCMRESDDVWTKRKLLLVLKLLQSGPAAYRALCRAMVTESLVIAGLVCSQQ